MVKVDSLTHQLLSAGLYIETKELVDLLNLYEEVTWNKSEYGLGRASYFFTFLDNVRMFKKKGNINVLCRESYETV